MVSDLPAEGAKGGEGRTSSDAGWMPRASHPRTVAKAMKRPIRPHLSARGRRESAEDLADVWQHEPAGDALSQ